MFKYIRCEVASSTKTVFVHETIDHPNLVPKMVQTIVLKTSEENARIKNSNGTLRYNDYLENIEWDDNDTRAVKIPGDINENQLLVYRKKRKQKTVQEFSSLDIQLLTCALVYCLIVCRFVELLVHISPAQLTNFFYLIPNLKMLMIIFQKQMQTGEIDIFALLFILCSALSSHHPEYTLLFQLNLFQQRNRYCHDPFPFEPFLTLRL